MVYRSHRWLRFPCCGKAFACPVCHELSGCEAAVFGALATRVLCGFCAHEQNYAAGATKCSGCGKDMLKKSSGHWDGGAGRRDVTSLSSKDRRKNKGAFLCWVWGGGSLHVKKSVCSRCFTGRGFQDAVEQSPARGGSGQKNAGTTGGC